MSTTEQQSAALARPVDKLKGILGATSVQEQIRNALGDAAPLFVASLIDVYASDRMLQECEPKAVVSEALKAATLRLPINRNLGFAYILPYRVHGKPTPTMQVGYKGYVQLAQRTAQYRYINTDAVYEGETVDVDRLTGEVTISGERTSDTPIGYFAHMETVTGFRKSIYWPIDKVRAHGQRYSQSFRSGRQSPWQTHFDDMARKTLVSDLLRKWGVMSVEMNRAIDEDIEGARHDIPTDREGGDLGSILGMTPPEDVIDVAPEAPAGDGSGYES